MGLHYRYSHPTTPAGSGFDIDLGAVVQVGAVDGLVTRAYTGDAGQCDITIDDPDGTLDIKGLHRFYVTEDECPAGDTVVWNGYITEQKISRSTYGETYLHGAARGWSVGLTVSDLQHRAYQRAQWSRKTGVSTGSVGNALRGAGVR